MGNPFKAPSPPSPPPPPPPPPTVENNAEIEAAKENERKRRVAAQGRSSTILTSGQGVMGDGATASSKRTLGA